jgi:hypothetical protein
MTGPASIRALVRVATVLSVIGYRDFGCRDLIPGSGHEGPAGLLES